MTLQFGGAQCVMHYYVCYGKVHLNGCNMPGFVCLQFCNGGELGFMHAALPELAAALPQVAGLSCTHQRMGMWIGFCSGCLTCCL